MSTPEENDLKLSALSQVILKQMDPNDEIHPGITCEDAKRCCLNRAWERGGVERVKEIEELAKEYES